MPKSAAKKKPKKSLQDHCEEIAQNIKVDVSQVVAVLDSDWITMPQSHHVTARILSALIHRGLRKV